MYILSIEEDALVASITLIDPKCDPSFWRFDHALPMFHKRATMPSAALPLVAALTPPEHQITLLDENVEPIDFERLAKSDIVCLTGMSVQRYRMVEILKEFKRRGCFTAVGGAWVTVKEDHFGELADVIFVGEAEESWPRFLKDWAQGRHQKRYEQAEKTDMRQVPMPRYDLLKMDRYLFGGIQLTRGCPYQCEFCDIIVTFGRRMRIKTVEQILAELELLYAHKIRLGMVVDDNLIGNRKLIKAVLPEIAAWQRRRGFPLLFATQVSLDLAEDEEMMRLMLDANISIVFIGIESPNEEALRETKKFQNVSKKRSILERIHHVQNAGFEVTCGMILGFDHDDVSIFEWHRQFIQASHITEALVGMLFAIPKTPLYSRLAADGRLDTADRSEFGTNVIPLRMSREALRNNYVKLMKQVYHPEAYFERLENFIARGGIQFTPNHAQYLREHSLAYLLTQSKYLVSSLFLFYELMRRVADPALRAEYRRRLLHALRAWRRPFAFFFYAFKCAMHYHYYSLIREMPEHVSPVYSSYQ